MALKNGQSKTQHKQKGNAVQKGKKQMCKGCELNRNSGACMTEGCPNFTQSESKTEANNAIRKA